MMPGSTHDVPIPVDSVGKAPVMNDELVSQEIVEHTACQGVNTGFVGLQLLSLKKTPPNLN